jgi:diadenosine tetraphosphate (Ap4A) HIT family hydrolase
MNNKISCPFCGITDSIISNDLVYAVWDKYPVSNGHILLLPFRHVVNYFELTKKEQFSLLELLDKAKEILEKQYKPDGYNIGINIGEAAGQSVEHLHLHLIPRYYGDIEDPRGGVRGVIPSKQKF